MARDKAKEQAFMAKFSTSELQADLGDAIQDIFICRIALIAGITHDRDGDSVKERLQTNCRIKHLIRKELKRRGA